MNDDRPADDRIREGVEHLQHAALDLIAAARIFLDLAEEIVRDPAPLVARARAATAADAGRDGDIADDGDDGVQRIRVV